MRYIIIIFFFLISTSGISQVRGVILNVETHKPVPYSNIGIENSIIGTTSDVDGHFSFKKSILGIRLVISSVGFETQHHLVTDSLVEIYLQPKTYELSNIIVKPNRKKLNLVVNEIPSRNCSNYLVCSGYPWITAKYFEYKKEYENLRFIKEVKILVTSKIDSAKFNLRIIEANDKGEPLDNISQNNIIIIANKGTHVYTQNLEDKHLIFPENGLFVALEWLIIDRNRFEFNYSMKGERKKIHETRFEPRFCAFPKQGSINLWTYSGGEWRRLSIPDHLSKGQKLDLAIELILTN